MHVIFCSPEEPTPLLFLDRLAQFKANEQLQRCLKSTGLEAPLGNLFSYIPPPITSIFPPSHLTAPIPSAWSAPLSLSQEAGRKLCFERGIQELWDLFKKEYRRLGPPIPVSMNPLSVLRSCGVGEDRLSSSSLGNSLLGDSWRKGDKMLTDTEYLSQQARPPPCPLPWGRPAKV